MTDQAAINSNDAKAAEHQLCDAQTLSANRPIHTTDRTIAQRQGLVALLVSQFQIRCSIDFQRPVRELVQVGLVRIDRGLHGTFRTGAAPFRDKIAQRLALLER